MGGRRRELGGGGQTHKKPQENKAKQNKWRGRQTETKGNTVSQQRQRAALNACFPFFSGFVFAQGVGSSGRCAAAAILYFRLALFFFPDRRMGKLKNGVLCAMRQKKKPTQKQPPLKVSKLR